jgi:hypothetical protein
MKQDYRAVSLRSRTELERAAWGRRKQAIVHQEKSPTSMEEPMTRYDRWKRIATPDKPDPHLGAPKSSFERWKRSETPEPPVPEPGSAWSRLLSVTASIEATGKINATDMVALAEGFELRHTPEEQDLARLCRAISRAHTIHS